MQKHMKQNNAGFSLVELIIVVAIMAVLTSVLTVSYFIVGKANMKSVATEFNLALGNSQSNTMGRMDNYNVYVTYDPMSGESTFRVGSNGEEHVLGNDQIQVSVWNGSEYIELQVNMVIAFSKSSGAVKDVRMGTHDINSGQRLGGSDGLSEYRFLFGDLAGKHYIVHLIQPTGKHYVE